jgi:hypothetical protein
MQSPLNYICSCLSSCQVPYTLLIDLFKDTKDVLSEFYKKEITYNYHVAQIELGDISKAQVEEKLKFDPWDRESLKVRFRIAPLPTCNKLVYQVCRP